MDNINVSFTPLKDWNSNPEWKAMDSTLKGFFSQLLLIASFNKPAGYLPDDDKLWRKWLNIPAKTFDEDNYDNFNIDQSEVAKTIKKYFDNPSSKSSGISSSMLDALESIWDEDDDNHNKKRNARISYDSWINYLWIFQWKPMLEKCLIKIDVKLRIQFEELDGYEGFFFPLAYSMSNVGNVVSSVKKELVKTTKTRKKGKKQSLPRPNILEAQALTRNDIGYDGLLWLENDNTPLSDFSKVIKVWRTPISSEKRKNIWDIGVTCLESSPSNYGKARSFLGKMVRDFSEEKVARTVAEMARRPTMALEPYALFKTIINSYEKGTLGEQKARLARTTVSL